MKTQNADRVAAYYKGYTEDIQAANSAADLEATMNEARKGITRKLFRELAIGERFSASLMGQGAGFVKINGQCAANEELGGSTIFQGARVVYVKDAKP